MPLRGAATVLIPPRLVGAETFLRLHNPEASPASVVVRSGVERTTLALDPSAIVDVPATAPAIELESADALVSTWRLVNDDELQLLTAEHTPTPFEACDGTVRIYVIGTACRFGTAGARLDPIAGATYRWTIDGGALLAGDGTPEATFGFGSAAAAVIRVEVTAPGCPPRAGAASISLRTPFEITSVGATPATVGTPVTVSWAYRGNEAPRTQRLTVGGEAVPISVAARSYTFTPTKEGAVSAVLEASLLGGRRRAVRVPGPSIPAASACASDRRAFAIDVRPPCEPPQGHITTSGPTTFCEGGSVTLTAPEGRSYEWSTGARNRSITVDTSGDYSVNVANGTGCERSFGPVAVAVSPLPVAGTIAAPDVIESGTSTEVFFTCSHCAVVTMIAPANQMTSPVQVNTTTWRSTFIDAAGPGTYTIRARGMNDCGTTEEVTKPILTDPGPYILDMTIAPSTIAFGQTATLKFSVNNGLSWSLHSALGNGFSQSSGGDVHGSYTVTYSAANNDGNDTITLTVKGRLRDVSEQVNIKVLDH